MTVSARVRVPLLAAGGGLVIGASVLLLALRYGGGAGGAVLPGLPDLWLTSWLLPAARLGNQVSATATVGFLLAAAVLAPRDRGRLSPLGYRLARAAAWPALLWSVSAIVVVGLTFADISALPLAEILSVPRFLHFATSVPAGRAFLSTAVLALAVTAISAWTLSVAGSVSALGLAVVAVLPPLFTGHAAAGGNHQIAVSGLILHVVPVTLWAGGLLALVLVGRSAADRDRAVRRFSVLAAWCITAVAVSGLVSATIRLPDPALWSSSRYGHLILIKTALLAAIGACGWWQRRTGLGRRFLPLAIGEILLFAAAMGAASALSRTPPPQIAGAPEETGAQSLLGFAMPAPLTAGRLFSDWLPEPLYLCAALVAAGLYTAGVSRLHRRGDRWPAPRTICFLLGCALLIFATNSGVARYAPVLFSVNMGQHLLLNMAIPILLVLAAPATLALRALRAARDDAWPGPREWLQQLLHSRLLNVLSHPVVALVVYVGSLYAMYLTGLYELSLRSHAAHLLMVGHFLLSGYLFFWVVIGVDPAPRRLGYPLRMMLVFAAMVFHAFLGVSLMQSTMQLAADWFASLGRPWWPNQLDDIRMGGGIAWSFGEIPAAIVLATILRQWMNADEREARRRDRAADRAEAEGREDAELAAYNAMLAELAAHDRLS